MMTNTRLNDIVNLAMVCGVIGLGIYYRVSGNYEAGVLGSTMALIELVKLALVG